METETQKISALAKSLKDLHLASTMDEATKRAKEIIEGSRQLHEIRQDVNDLNTDLLKDVLDHNARKLQTEQVSKDIKRDKKRADELKEIIDLAEELRT